MTSDAPAHTTRTCTRNPPAHTKKNDQWGRKWVSRLHFQLFWALSDHSVGVVKVTAA